MTGEELVIEIEALCRKAGNHGLTPNEQTALKGLAGVLADRIEAEVANALRLADQRK